MWTDAIGSRVTAAIVDFALSVAFCVLAYVVVRWIIGKCCRRSSVGRAPVS